MNKIYTVAQDGSGDFSSIQDAINTNEQNLTIYLKPGIYYEQIFSKKNNLKIIGQDAQNTIITFNIGAKDIHPDGSKFGTFRTYTAYFAGNSVYLENITIENSAGQGTVVGQAVALYASASFVYCKNVKLLGYQDTLFTAPLPEKERLVGGFKGPEEFLPRIPSKQLYENCYICGTIDFIFGSADVVFQKCTIGIHDTTTECYIAAPSTKKDGLGYVFDNCNIEKVEPYNVLEHKPVYLGRPWREYAKCCFMKSKFSDIICKESWDNWGNPENEKTISFNTYKNSWNFDGIAGKCSFSNELTDEQVLELSKQAKDLIYLVANSCSKEA